MSQRINAAETARDIEADDPGHRLQLSVRHHFTPVFYLKAWASDGHVTRYYRPQKEVVPSPIAPKRTGFEPHLYTLHGVPPEQQDWLETQFFKPVDSRAAVARQLLLDGGLNRLTNEQRVDWARFMMSMQLRSPFSLNEVKLLADQLLRENLRRDDPEFEALREPDDPDNIYDWTLRHDPQVIENAHKRFLPGLIDHEGLGRYLVNMHWAAVDVSRAHHTLLTSDRPFIATHGWKDMRTALLFPISPDLLFVATNGPQQTAQILKKTPNHLVRYVNDQIVRCAVCFVFGTDGSHREFVERRLRMPSDWPVAGPAGRNIADRPT